MNELMGTYVRAGAVEKALNDCIRGEFSNRVGLKLIVITCLSNEGLKLIAERLQTLLNNKTFVTGNYVSIKKPDDVRIVIETST